MPRRSISQSLSAREIDFIKAPLVEEQAKPQESKPAARHKPPQSTVQQKKKDPVEKPANKKQRTEQSNTHSMLEPWVTITTRLPNSLHARLRRVAFERTERGEEQSTIQDILAAAALEWLEENEPHFEVVEKKS